MDAQEQQPTSYFRPKSMDIEFLHHLWDEPKILDIRHHEPGLCLQTKGMKTETTKTYVLMVLTSKRVYLFSMTGRATKKMLSLRYAQIHDIMIDSSVSKDITLNKSVNDHLTPIRMIDRGVASSPSRTSIVLCAFEPQSNLFFHLQRCWLNALACAAVPPPSCIFSSKGEMRDAFHTFMSDFMTRPTSCRRRTEILTHLTPILRTNVIMKQLFLQSTISDSNEPRSMMLWPEYMCHEIQRVATKTCDLTQPSVTLEELEYVRECLATLASVCFASESISGTCAFLHESSRRGLGAFLNLLLMSFKRRRKALDLERTHPDDEMLLIHREDRVLEMIRGCGTGARKKQQKSPEAQAERLVRVEILDHQAHVCLELMTVRQVLPNHLPTLSIAKTLGASAFFSHWFSKFLKRFRVIVRRYVDDVGGKEKGCLLDAGDHYQLWCHTCLLHALVTRDERIREELRNNHDEILTVVLGMPDLLKHFGPYSCQYLHIRQTLDMISSILRVCSSVSSLARSNISTKS